MAPQRKDPRLTKTKYLSARQCHKRVWYEIWRPHVLAPPTLSQRRIMDQGTDMGELARLRDLWRAQERLSSGAAGARP